MLVFLPARAGGESEEEDAFRADEAVNAKPSPRGESWHVPWNIA